MWQGDTGAWPEVCGRIWDRAEKVCMAHEVTEGWNSGSHGGVGCFLSQKICQWSVKMGSWKGRMVGRHGRGSETVICDRGTVV